MNSAIEILALTDGRWQPRDTAVGRRILSPFWDMEYASGNPDEEIHVPSSVPLIRILLATSSFRVTRSQIFQPEFVSKLCFPDF
jgi:hypothetical protein